MPPRRQRSGRAFHGRKLAEADETDCTLSSRSAAALLESGVGVRGSSAAGGVSTLPPAGNSVSALSCRSWYPDAPAVARAPAIVGRAVAGVPLPVCQYA